MTGNGKSPEEFADGLLPAEPEVKANRDASGRFVPGAGTRRSAARAGKKLAGRRSFYSLMKDVAKRMNKDYETLAVDIMEKIVKLALDEGDRMMLKMLEVRLLGPDRVKLEWDDEANESEATSGPSIPERDNEARNYLVQILREHEEQAKRNKDAGMVIDLEKES